MLLATILLTLSAFASALPPPAKRCNALLENTPWIIRNLTAFQPAPDSQSDAFIAFHFCDVNPGLELETTCARNAPADSSGQSVVDPTTYFACEGNQVRFIYSGDELSLERSYVDDCLGAYPYNHGIAGGHASTDVVNTMSAAGNTCTQDVLSVKITELW
ncbi:hypothetical protein LTR53_007128 [Teratosphaeriaceae sp. CCFEE 6253]|nr:hypothetical protein LTR53_007128 [Teratosphaeriaceae sp. CCFEE 6253]